MLVKILKTSLVGLSLFSFSVSAEESTQPKKSTKEKPVTDSADTNGAAAQDEGVANSPEKNIGTLNFDGIVNNFGSMLDLSGKTINNNAPDAEKTTNNLGDAIEKSGDTITGK